MFHPLRAPSTTRSRLILLVAVILAPIAIFAIALFWQFASTERARVRTTAERTAQQISATIDLEIVGLTAALEALATSPSLQPGGDLAVFDAQARSVLRTRGSFIVLRRRDGHVLVNTSRPFGTPLPSTTDPIALVADREVFETGKPLVSDLFTGSITGVPLIMIDAPVFADGAITCTLNVALEPRRLAAILAAAAPPDWTVSLLDRRDRIIARSRQQEQYVGSEATPDLRQVATGTSGTWQGWTLDGTKVIGGYARSRLSGWRVAVGVPLSTIERPLLHLMVILAGSGVLVFVLSTVSAAHFARSINAPIQLLAQAASRLGRGETLPTVVTGLRELDEVAHALTESQARLRAVFEAVPVGVVIAEAPSGRIIDGNAQTERILGHPIRLSEGVESYHLWESFHPDGRPVDSAEYPLARVIRNSEERPELEVLYNRGDGHGVWVRLIAAPVRDPAGALTGGVVAILDIDREKRAETELRELNATLERRVTQMAADRDRIWRISAELMVVAKFDSEIVALNPAWTATLGWTERELVGSHFMDLVHPDDLASTREEAASLALGLATVRFENRYRHRDGSYRWLSWAAVPDAGLIHAIARDVTAEKTAAEALQRAEEQLRQSQKMEVVGQLTGGVAHDFNNLLTVISGHVELARQRMRSEGPDSRLARNLDSALEGARRAAVLTHRLLAFSRRSPLRPEVVDLNVVVSGMADLIRRSLGEDIAIEMAAAIGLWQVEADPNQVENAILNLCVNARDAMPDGGKLTIETANVILDENAASGMDEVKAGDYAMVAISDTGFGMPPKVRERVFEPFFTTKPVGKGTGLGLSQVFGFMRQSGGHAAIYSELDMGTTVKLYFPRLQQSREPEQPQAVPVEAPVIAAGNGEKILVIEDEDMVREFTVSTLEEAGYQVLAAVEGPAGLALLDAHPDVALLFTDVVLAGPANGRKVAQEALRRRPGLKVLFTTGYTRNAIVHHGRLDRDADVISKPFTAAALLGRVQQALGYGAGGNR